MQKKEIKSNHKRKKCYIGQWPIRGGTKMKLEEEVDFVLKQIFLCVFEFQENKIESS